MDFNLMIDCINFRSFEEDTILGYADLYIPVWGLEILNAELHKKYKARWVNLPAKKCKLKDGKEIYFPIMRFRNKAHDKVFCEEAKKAIDKWREKNEGKS